MQPYYLYCKKGAYYNTTVLQDSTMREDPQMLD
jgi:hypothetical protein